MSELDDALAMLERAVRRLEAAPLLGDSKAAVKAAAERAADDEQIAATAAAIVARVDAALAKLGLVLDGGG